jgi:hypothetical protein
MAVSHFASRNMPGAALRPAPFVGRCAAIAVLASLGGCAPRAAPAPGPHGDRLLHFVLDSSLARDRDSYEREVSRALADVYAFFSAAGLDLTGKLIDSVTVFGGPAKARAYLASTYGVSVEQIPATFSGTVEGTSLFLVSRGAYQQIWHRLYPDWNWTTNTYRQLVAHELCHRAHEIVVTARFGSADAMGPAWFFEGFAVTCAGQFHSEQGPMSLVEIQQQVGSHQEPTSSYPLYGRLVRSLAARYGIKLLIESAAQPGFPDMLWSSKQ